MFAKLVLGALFAACMQPVYGIDTHALMMSKEVTKFQRLETPANGETIQFEFAKGQNYVPASLTWVWSKSPAGIILVVPVLNLLAALPQNIFNVLHAPFARSCLKASDLNGTSTLELQSMPNNQIRVIMTSKFTHQKGGTFHNKLRHVNRTMNVIGDFQLSSTWESVLSGKDFRINIDPKKYDNGLAYRETIEQLRQEAITDLAEKKVSNVFLDANWKGCSIHGKSKTINVYCSSDMNLVITQKIASK